MLPKEEMPQSWEKNHLFFMIFERTEKLISCYETPYHIVENIWREHVLYDHDRTPSTVIDFMYNMSKEYGFRLVLESLNQKKERTIDDVHVMSFLFLASYSVIFKDIIFGWVKLPDQMEYLVGFLSRGLQIESPMKVAQTIIHRTPFNRVYETYLTPEEEQNADQSVSTGVLLQ